MSDVNAHLLAQRIDTVLDILVAEITILRSIIWRSSKRSCWRWQRTMLNNKTNPRRPGNLNIEPCRSRPYGPVARHIAPNSDVAMNARQQSIFASGHR